ncbi:MAG: hypothetical protein K8R77_14485 [Anaerolineaceae bacterium]|nr:hypothetical protein [Anaerolineaceae bacterium]
MTMNESDNAGGGKFSRALLGLLRFILVVAVGAMLGVAGIFCAQYVYRQATAPAKANARRLDGMETQQASVHGQLDERMADFNERLAALEAQADVARNDVAGVQASQQALEDFVQQLDENLGGLGKLEAELEAELADLRSEMDIVHTRVARVTFTPTAAPAMDDLETLAREVKLLKALELLSRSRLHFLSADYGLAEKDIQNAYRVLVDVQVAGLAPKTEMYDEILSRLKQTGRHLPASPRIAQNDLETAWDLLVEILTNPIEEQETITPTPLPSLGTGTLYPTPNTWTPTPLKSPVSTATPTPTPTPWVTPTPSAT